VASVEGGRVEGERAWAEGAAATWLVVVAARALSGGELALDSLGASAYRWQKFVLVH
jgi:hypothetical protein